MHRPSLLWRVLRVSVWAFLAWVFTRLALGMLVLAFALAAEGQASGLVLVPLSGVSAWLCLEAWRETARALGVGPAGPLG
jgi:hypothetical protein